MRKNLFKRSFAWFGVVVLLVSTLFLPLVKNAFAIEAPNVGSWIEQATKVQMVNATMKKCMSKDTASARTSSSTTSRGETYTTYHRVSASEMTTKLFSWQGDTNIPTGAWLENAVQGKIDDGEIYCSNNNSNIFAVYLDVMGLKYEDVFCNGEKPGIMYAYGSEKITTACKSLINNGDYTFGWNTTDGADLAYLKKLYENYKSKNPSIGQFLPAWGDLGNYKNDANNYFMYLREFTTACSTSPYTGDESIINKNKYFKDKVKIVDGKTGEIKSYYYSNQNMKASGWDSSMVSSSAGAHTCADVIGRLNDTADTASKKVKEKSAAAVTEAKEQAKSRCNGIAGQGLNGDPSMSVAAQLDLAKKIIADPETARETVVAQNPNASEAQIKKALEDVKKRAEHVKAELEPLIASGIYWEEGTGDKEGEIVCKTWPSVFNGDITPESNFAIEQTEWTNKDDNPKEDGDYCYSAGLESMSWILCPATTNMSSAVHGIDTLLDQWLSTDTGLYENGSGAAIAWSYFRDIANILIIIILLVIIFSQLTGYGIDNYGIKRMLPRLIIMAVLINLSLIICQIAIDLSNILGQGLNNFFNSIGNTIIGNNTTAGNMVEEGVAGLVTSLLAAAAGVAAGSGAIIGGMSLITGGGGGVMIIVSLILALLVALVAVLMFFVMLGARMIIIIMFTAIAPVAFACYILPNTQGLFKKWWNIFKTALVVYPICGALYGMSYVIKATIFTGSNGLHLWMAVVAVCAPFLPFLMLPGLLKGALAALGAVGGTLAMLGNGLRGSLASGQKSIKESDAYKNEKVQQQRNQNKWAAGYYRNGNRMWNDKGERLGKDGEVMVGKDGKAKRVSGFGQFIRGGQTGIAAATARHLKDEESINAENRVLSDAGRMSAEAEIEAKGKTQMVGAYESLLNNGAATIDNGKTTVNATNSRQVGAYHREALSRYQAAARAGDAAAMNEAAAQIKAAQNILSKTDLGRAEVVKNLQGSARNGQMEGLNVAAGHLLSEFGNQYKSTDRGAFDMLNNLSDGRAAEEIQSKLDTPILDENGNIKIDEKSGKEMWDITAGGYSTMGTKAYTPESLAGADDRTIQNMALAVEQRKLSDEGLSDIQRTAYQAIENAKNGRLNVKPEVMRQLERIAAGYDPNSIKITHTPSTPPSSSTDGSGAGGGYGVDTSTWD